jgi:predicted RNase H-like nuclease
MPLVAGVDGCPKGWIYVARDTETGEVSSTLFGTGAELVSQLPCPEVIAIDIPIGLLAPQDPHFAKGAGVVGDDGRVALEEEVPIARRQDLERSTIKTSG